MIKNLLALMAIPPVLLYCAAPARADSNSYLWEIHSVKAQHGNQDEFMVHLGYAICGDLSDGATIYDIGAVMTHGPKSPFTPFEAGEIIYASVDQLCPSMKPKAMREVNTNGAQAIA